MTSPTSLDRAALAAHVAIANVAKDRERGIQITTNDLVRRVASAVITVHEDYGPRRCKSCLHWNRLGEEGWGQCGMVEGEAEGAPYLAGEEGILVTPEMHGCLGWIARKGSGS